MTNKLTVEQVDRDAAADAMEPLYSPAKITAMRKGIITGKKP